MSDELHIGINKNRLAIHMVLYGVLAIASLIGGFGAAEAVDSYGTIFMIIGVVVGLLFFLGAGAKARRRSDKTAGITFSKEGIMDNSSAYSLGMIKWKDVKNIEEDLSREYNMLIIAVRKHGEYVKRAKNSAVEQLLQKNIKDFGTPIVIEASRLNCTAEELIDLAIKQRKK